MSKLTIDTIPKDVYRLMENGVTDTEALDRVVNNFSVQLSSLMKRRLTETLDTSPKAKLRMSNIGKPHRLLWYEANQPHLAEKLPGQTRIKFMYGDIVESMILCLIELAGHKVERQQERVRLEGVPGSIDAVIDDVLVDVKSASSRAFVKFDEGTLPKDDSFGYIQQLFGYSEAEPVKDSVTGSAFIAVNKESGAVAVYRPDYSGVTDPKQTIHRAREAMDQETPPDRCHPDKEYGKSGNRTLGTSCSYCPFKKHCWSDSNGGKGLRTFIYSTGPVFFTHVENEPKVFEVINVESN